MTTFPTFLSGFVTWKRIFGCLKLASLILTTNLNLIFIYNHNRFILDAELTVLDFVLLLIWTFSYVILLSLMQGSFVFTINSLSKQRLRTFTGGPLSVFAFYQGFSFRALLNIDGLTRPGIVKIYAIVGVLV